MNRYSVLVILTGLFAAAAIAGVTTFEPNTDQSTAASDGFWPEDVRETYQRLCLDQLTQSKAASQPPPVHLAFCDCQIAEAEKWLKPVDVTIILAAINGESDAELEARALALPKPEAMASEKRMRNYTKALLGTCVRASRDAASNLMGTQ